MWAWVALACGGWAGGQAIWSYYEMVAHDETPFPSLADAGYLIFPLAGAMALWLYPSPEGDGSRRRRLLDGLIVAGALTFLSWTFILRHIIESNDFDSALAAAVSIGYPVGDIVLLTMAVTVVAKAGENRAGMAILAAGYCSMAVGDSGFAYLTAKNEYATGALTDLGWFAAFALIAVAAVAARPIDERAASSASAAALSVLPYIPLLLALGVGYVQAVRNHEMDAFSLTLALVIVACVLVRQFSALRENKSLAAALASRERELHQQAFSDSLTGLANRSLFTDRVAHALELQQRAHNAVAVLFCDLDDFKVVNDTLGHAAGDELLVRVAERLLGSLRPGDTLARLGGDEFAVLLEGGTDAPEAVAGRILDSVKLPFHICDRVVTVGVSVGVATATADCRPADTPTLLAHADVAMYAAKRSGRGSVRFYETGMTLPELVDAELRTALGRALDDRALSVAYQPMVELATGDIRAFEALVRWRHDGVDIPPSRFIPVTERHGLVAELTDQVMEEACAQLARWSAEAGHSRLRMSVNVAPELMSDESFPARVAAVAARHRLERGQLVLEITETALLSDVKTARQVSKILRSLGMRLALDDFGTGYSSLVHLQHIELDSIKLDGAFLAGLGGEAGPEVFIRAIIRLADDLGLNLVAEGVERTEQQHALRQLGCGLAQGYLFARPAPPSSLEAVTRAVRAAYSAGVVRSLA